MQKTKGMLLGSDTFEITRGKLNITLAISCRFKGENKLVIKHEDGYYSHFPQS